MSQPGTTHTVKHACFRLAEAVDAENNEAEQITVATADVGLLLTYLQTLQEQIELRDMGGAPR